MNNIQIVAQIAQLAKLAADLQRQLTPAPAPRPVVLPVVGKKPSRRTRAYFYLQVLTDGAESDIIYRVLGKGGMAAANRLENEIATSGGGVTERLNSREYQILVERRRQQIKHGETGRVGCIEAVPLTGTVEHARNN